MTTARPIPHPYARAAADDLAGRGSHLVRSAEFCALTGSSPADWSRFARNWDDLLLDTFMADGGTYRYRRYSQFDLDLDTDTLTRLPHGPYRQEEDVNQLNGGVDRYYEPLTDALLADPLLRASIVEPARIFAEVHGSATWNVKVTPIRIIATGDEAGQPTPEGPHSDGATFITALLIGRRNVTGGESTVYRPDGGVISSATLDTPGDILLSDDRRTLHGVTPLHPERRDRAAHRDVLIMAYAAL